MRRFLPCLAYSMPEVDPGYDTSRDEGEARLCRLRPLLGAATKSMALQHFLEAAHPASLASMLSPGTPQTDRWSVAEREGVTDSLLKSDSQTKPCVTLVRNTVRLLESREVDKLDDADLFACVPVKRCALVAMPDSPPKRERPSAVVVTWPKSTFAVAKGATRPTVLTVNRIGKQSARFDIDVADGTRRENLIATDVPASVLDTLFAPGDAAVRPSVTLETLSTQPRLPTAAGELPEILQLQLAGFMQIRLRAHVLAAAAGPLLTSRPLWFENFKLSWRKAGGGKKPAMVVKALLHTCSATCFCGAHALPPPKKRWPNAKLTGKQSATLTLEMCSSAIVDAGCATHGSNCARNAQFAPGRCCDNIKAFFECYHECKMDAAAELVDGKKAKRLGTFIPCGALGIDDSAARRSCGALEPWAWRELSMLLAMCAEFDQRARPLFGTEAPKDAKMRLTQVVVDAMRELDRRVEEFDRTRMSEAPGPSDEDLARLDVRALRCLREGGLVHAKVTPTRKTPRPVYPDSNRTPSTEEKKLFRPPHHWLFPLHDQPYGRRVFGGTAIYGMDDPTTSTNGDSTETPSVAGDSDVPQAKRLRTDEPEYDNPEYAYESITEYYDVEGMRKLRQQLEAIMAQPDLPERQHRRGLHFAQFLDALDRELGPEVDGPLGWPARTLVCKYRTRYNGGRLYATGMAKVCGANDGEARSVCTQGAMRESRPFFCCRWAHDYDMKNAQPQIMRQMKSVAKLTWTDGRVPAPMPELEAWCANRPEFIEHVAEVHRMPVDSERFHEYRKDMVKELVISLLFGGSYNRWLRDFCHAERRNYKTEPRSPRIDRLADELKQLRNDVFTSQQWIGFVEKDRKRLRDGGKKQDEAEIDRSVMARIAQTTENVVLNSMRAYLKENGWTALTLCFDGLHVSKALKRTRRLPPPPKA